MSRMGPTTSKGQLLSLPRCLDSMKREIFNFKVKVRDWECFKRLIRDYIPE